MAGVFAKGTKLYVGDGASPEGFSAVANVTSIKGLDFDVTVVDTTTHDTEGNYREKTAVLIDPGKLTFDSNFDPADASLDPSTAGSLFDSMDQLERRNFQVRLSAANAGSKMLQFAGFVTKHGFTFPVDNIQKASIEITADGRPTWGTYA